MRLSLAAAGLLMIGCGGDGGDATARTPTASATPTATATATAAPSPASAQAARPGLRLKRIGTFSSPVHLTAPPGDRRRLFVVEQAGRIVIVRDGKKLSTPFLDISSRISSGGERGLLSLAFAPDYVQSGLFYIYYTAADGSIRIVEYQRASTNRAARGSARIVLSQPHPASNHNGGLVAFGPDGLLYAGLGDGGGGGDRHGSRGNGQNLGSLLGKILRLDPRAQAAAPTACRLRTRSSAGAARAPRSTRTACATRGAGPSIRAPTTSSIADVGQGEVEEVSIVRGPGANLGWRVFEGRSRYSPGESAPGHVPPVIQRLHSNGNCSITGGIVVRDRALSALRGRYIFGDLCRGRDRVGAAGAAPRRGASA